VGSWPITLGLIVAGILVLIPIVMIGRLIFQIITSGIEQRRAEWRKITVAIPDLGKFSTTDNELWCGEVEGLAVSIRTPGGAPTEPSIRQFKSVLDRLPALMTLTKAYLAEHEDMTWLESGAAGFEPYGINFETGANFVVESTHPSDPDGVYRVTFRNDVAVSSGRDD